MDDSILHIILKILIFSLIIWCIVTLSVAFFRKGKRFSKTEWPYSVVESARFLSLGKYMDLRGWKFTKREIVGFIIMLLVFLAGMFITKFFPN